MITRIIVRGKRARSGSRCSESLHHYAVQKPIMLAVRAYLFNQQIRSRLDVRTQSHQRRVKCGQNGFPRAPSRVSARRQRKHEHEETEHPSPTTSWL